jgi:hypothetical protein
VAFGYPLQALWAEQAGQNLESAWCQIHELEPDIELRRAVLAQLFDPHDLGGVREGREIVGEDLHLHELAHSVSIVAEDANAAE